MEHRLEIRSDVLRTYRTLLKLSTLFFTHTVKDPLARELFQYDIRRQFKMGKVEQRRKVITR